MATNVDQGNAVPVRRTTPHRPAFVVQNDATKEKINFVPQSKPP